MKCLALFAFICCVGFSCAQSGVSTEFLQQNVLNPMLQSIQQNALNLLQQNIQQLIANLFGTPTVGKRDLASFASLNLNQLLAPFVGKVKEIYQKLFQVFVQIVDHAQDWIQKPDWARIQFLNAGLDAVEAISHVNIGAEYLKPLINLVQTHLQALIPDFQAIIHQAIAAVQKPLL